MKPVSPILLAIVGAALLSLTIDPCAFAQSGTGTVQILDPDGESPCVGISWLTGTGSAPTGAWLSGTGYLAGASVNASSGPTSAGWGGVSHVRLTNSSGGPVTFSPLASVTYQATASRTTGSGHPYGQADIYVYDDVNDTSYAEIGDGINHPSGLIITHEIAVYTMSDNTIFNETGMWNVYADLNYH